MKKIWTKERCKEEAMKYSLKYEFQKGNQSAYRVARKNNWLNNYDWFINGNVKWTYEKCFGEAMKYSSKIEFCKGNESAYRAARKNKWLDDYKWFTSKFIWTKEKCRKEASKYLSRGEFRKGNMGAYLAAWKNKWLDEFYEESKRKGRGYWTYERCFEEASKYSSRNKFQKGSGSAYDVARRNKWLDEFYKEKHNLNDPRCVYSYEFITESIKAVYVGITYMWRIKIRDNEHRTRKDSVSSFAKKYNIPIPEVKILEEGITIESKNKEDEWLDKKYRKEGSWIILNKAKGGSLGSSRIWTYKTCFEEAKKYSSRNEFSNGSGGAYYVACKNKWLDDYNWFTSKFIWTKERCKEEAKKYSSRYEFYKRNGSAYSAALKNKWLDEFYGKSKNRERNYWTKEKCKEEASKYFSRNEFRKGSSAYRVAWKNKWLDEFFPKSF